MRRIEGVDVELDASGRGVVLSLQFQHPRLLGVFRQVLRSGEALELSTPAGWRAVRIMVEEVQQGQGAPDVQVFRVRAVGGDCET